MIMQVQPVAVELPQLEIEAMTDAEVIHELNERGQSFTKEQFLELESRLILRAACLHWTGDPLKQPARAVLCAVRQIQKKQEPGS